MVPSLRQTFNTHFTQEKYAQYIATLEALHTGALDFRNSETPIFIDRDFTKKMLSACESITDVICSPDFLAKTDAAVPSHLKVANESPHSHFIAFDFGICQNENGSLEPQLIEMQGFPTLFAYQAAHTAITRNYANVPNTYDAYLNGYNQESYLQLLKEVIVGQHDPKHVVLLEIFPEQQKTRIDFYSTQQALGIAIVCLTKLIRKENKLYYEKNGELIEIKRIYNRLIFDDLEQQSAEVQKIGEILFDNLIVEWVPHPNWFYRISKYTLPLINHPYVPTTSYLSDIATLPADLENYVLKPLFSFAGQGVVIDVTPKDIANIKDPENWILQKKVHYADVIETPDGFAKAEIRLFYFWKDGWARPVAVHNLARMSKGKMIGTRYNKDKEWVGGSVAFFEV
jgi:hypothetical protein